MLKPTVLLISVISMLFACSHSKHTSVRPAQSMEIIRDVPSFSRVDVKGRIDVNLHSGYKNPKVILQGGPRDLSNVTATVKNGTLYINVRENDPKQHGRMKATIRTTQLRAFKYSGAGTINAPRLNTRALDLYIDNTGRTVIKGHVGVRRLEILGAGSTEIKGLKSTNLCLKLHGKPRVQLSGVVNLARLDMKDDAWLALNWINSPALIIRAQDRAFIQLAGVVDKLDVVLRDKACLRGRYLRADRAFVKTFGTSVASITALKRQHTLASDGSDIRFYNLSDMRTDFMAFNGSVLDMRDWHPFIEQYDQYNK